MKCLLQWLLSMMMSLDAEEAEKNADRLVKLQQFCAFQYYLGLIGKHVCEERSALSTSKIPN